MPRNVSLIDEPDRTLTAFRELMQKAQNGGGRVQIDFRDVKSIRFGALGYMLSLVDLCREQNERQCEFIAIRPHCPDVCAMFVDSGFVRYLEGDISGWGPGSPGINSFSITTGQETDAERTWPLAEFVCDVLPGVDHDRGHKMHGIITELMANVSNHAYPGQAGKLWLMALHEPKKNAVAVTFFDQGLGIPSSIRRKGVVLGGGELALRAHRVERLQQTCLHQLLRQNRGPTGLRVGARKARRKTAKLAFGKIADATQRVVGGDQILELETVKQKALGVAATSHAGFLHTAASKSPVA